VGTMVVLVETQGKDPSLDSRAIAELAKLGITNLALVRDKRTIGIVLEGWAFEPAASADAALAIVAADAASARALLPLGEMALSARQEVTGA
jgi:hypothetical protein